MRPAIVARHALPLCAAFAAALLAEANEIADLPRIGTDEPPLRQGKPADARSVGAT